MKKLLILTLVLMLGTSAAFAYYGPRGGGGYSRGGDCVYGDSYYGRGDSQRGDFQERGAYRDVNVEDLSLQEAKDTVQVFVKENFPNFVLTGNSNVLRTNFAYLIEAKNSGKTYWFHVNAFKYVSGPIIDKQVNPQD